MKVFVLGAAIKMMSKAYRNSFNALVVGNNLCAWIIAEQLSQNNPDAHIALVTNTLSAPSNLNFTNMGLIPLTEENKNALHWLSQLMETPLTLDDTSREPVYFHNGQEFSEKDGGKKFDHPWVKTLACQKYIRVTMPNWLEKFKEKFSGEIIEGCEITDVQVKDGRVQSLTLNGTQDIQAERFLFCTPPQSTLKTLSHSDFSQIQWPQWPQWWSALQLQLNHPEINEKSLAHKDQLHILAPRRTEDQAFLGAFALDGKSSLWQAFIPDAQAYDTESVTRTMKQLKEQIRQAHPELFNLVEEERIVFTLEHCHLNPLSDKEKFTIPLRNLDWLSPVHDHSAHSLMTQIQQAQGYLSDAKISA